MNAYLISSMNEKKMMTFDQIKNIMATHNNQHMGANSVNCFAAGTTHYTANSALNVKLVVYAADFHFKSMGHCYVYHN